MLDFDKSKIVTAINKVTSMKITGVSNIVDSVEKLVKMAKGMASVKGDSADGFTKTMNKLGTTSVDGFVKAFKDIDTEMSKAGQSGINSFVSAVKNKYSSVTSTAKDGVDKFINAFKDSGSKITTAGQNVTVALVKGIESKLSSVTKAANSITDKAVSGLSPLKSKATSAGNDFGSGLVSGINAKKTAVYNAAYALGQKAVQGEKDGQKSKSPSKLTRLAGHWFGEGLVLGIEDMGRSVYNAGSDLGETAIDTMSSTISNIARVIESDIDAQPTIRPVLDLSDVKSNAAAIGGLLGGDASIGVLANVGTISSMMNRRGQNGVNTEVVSAINKLRKDMGNLDRATYNINGVSYSEDSDVANAIQTIVRAARVERRTR